MENTEKEVNLETEQEVNLNTEETADKEPKAKAKRKDKSKEQIEALKKELEEKNDTMLRLAAEYDNYRRRTAKEKDETYRHAVSDTVKGLFAIIDNFERAFSCEYTETDFSKGISLVYKQFTEYLSGLGITKIEALGKEFDPNLHYAVAHCEDESVSENCIVEVLQTGYMIGDKVFRPAMVKVAN